MNGGRTQEEQGMKLMEVNGSHCYWNEEELEIAEFLTTLPEFIPEAEKLREKVRQPFTVVWGKQRLVRNRRTRENTTTTTSTSACTAFERWKTPAPVTKAAAAATATRSQQEVKKGTVQAASPSTPLCFSPSSESEESSSSISQHKTKRKRDDDDKLTRTVEELTECQKRLRKEVENVASYHQKQMAFNKILKKEEEKQMTVPSANCTTHQQREETEVEEVKRHNFKFNLGERSGQLYQADAVVNPPPPPQQNLQSHLMMVNQNPLTALSESQPRTCGPNLHLQLHFQSPSPVLYGPVPVFPKQEMGFGSIHCKASVDYARAIVHGQARARAQAAEARKFRKMVVNGQKLQMKSKFNPKSCSGTELP